MTTDKSLTTESSALPAVVVRGGFVYADGVKICRVGPGGTLLFHDKDRRRQSERRRAGLAEPDQVVVRVEALVQVVQPPSVPPSTLPRSSGRGPNRGDEKNL